MIDMTNQSEGAEEEGRVGDASSSKREDTPPALRQDPALIEKRPEDLTPMQAYLAELIVLEGLPKSQAIEKAGYAWPGAGFAAIRSPKFEAYVQDLIREHLLESSIKAAQTIRSLMTNAKSDYVRLEASKDVLDRAGFKPVEKHAHLLGGKVSINIDLGE